MTLQINGEPREFPNGLTVGSLVTHLGMKPDRVAVELNLEIVPRAGWDAALLKDGDKLEIVHFVGGGSQIDTANSPTTQDVPAGQIDSPATTSPAPADWWACPNCDTAASGAFCPDCGEKHFSSGDLSVRHLLAHAMEVVFHADSKIFRSFRFLFSRPGFLSAEFARGRRKPYLHPFQVFFVANLIYFFVQPLTGWTGLRTPLYVHMNLMSYSRMASRLVQHRIVAKGVSMEEFTRAFNHTVDLHARSLVVLMVPIFALGLWALEWRKRRFFGEHIVFALHFYAFWLIAFFILLFGLSTPVLHLLARGGMVFSDRVLDTFLSQVGEAGLFVYLVVALRIFYRDRIVLAMVKAALLVAATLYITAFYRLILFVTSLYSV